MGDTFPSGAPLFTFSFCYTPEIMLDATRLANRERIKRSRIIGCVFTVLAVVCFICSLLDYPYYDTGLMYGCVFILFVGLFYLISLAKLKPAVRKAFETGVYTTSLRQLSFFEADLSVESNIVYNRLRYEGLKQIVLGKRVLILATKGNVFYTIPMSAIPPEQNQAFYAFLQNLAARYQIPVVQVSQK